MTNLECNKCHILFNLNSDNFYIITHNPLKYKKSCIQCEKKRVQEYRKNNREKIAIAKKKDYQNNKNRYIIYAKQYAAQLHIKDKNKERNKVKRKEDPKFSEKHKISCKKYRDNNKDKARKAKKTYYYNNLEKLRKYARERARTEALKIKARIYYKNTNTTKKRLRNTIRSSIIYFLKRKGNIKKGSLLNYLDYSLNDLISHIESLWEPWMNWNNWGLYYADTWSETDQSTWTWQIDHIKRHREFDYNSMEHPDFKKCWALDNLRPLSAKENVIRQ
jgi:hypothetical protein